MVVTVKGSLLITFASHTMTGLSLAMVNIVSVLATSLTIYKQSRRFTVSGTVVIGRKAQ